MQIANDVHPDGSIDGEIENESFNLLKNNGYHLQHNFEHGYQGLSNLLLTLNLLAFNFHTTCDQLCQLWHTARTSFSRRHRFFVTLDIINNFIFFQDWQELLTRHRQLTASATLTLSLAHTCAAVPLLRPKFIPTSIGVLFNNNFIIKIADSLHIYIWSY